MIRSVAHANPTVQGDQWVTAAHLSIANADTPYRVDVEALGVSPDINGLAAPDVVRADLCCTVARGIAGPASAPAVHAAGYEVAATAGLPGAGLQVVADPAQLNTVAVQVRAGEGREVRWDLEITLTRGQ